MLFFYSSSYGRRDIRKLDGVLTILYYMYEEYNFIMRAMLCKFFLLLLYLLKYHIIYLKLIDETKIIRKIK